MILRIRRGLAKVFAFLHFSLRAALFQLQGFFRETLTIQTKQGRLTVSTRDHGIAKPLFCTRQFEYDASLHAIRFLKAKGFIPEHPVHMLDVGANIGVIGIGLALSKEVDSVIAIEPDPTNFALLTRNVEQNGLSDRITCLQMAAGDQEATLTMELSPLNLGDHRVRSNPASDVIEAHNESSRQTIQVPSMPLDRIMQLPNIRDSAAARPSMLWIDVQGYEGFIFAGAGATLRSGIPAVAEVWPYGIVRAGMTLDQFTNIVSGIWSDYWIERRGRFVRYPISVFDRYLDELGNGNYFENVIFTKSAPR